MLKEGKLDGVFLASMGFPVIEFYAMPCWVDNNQVVCFAGIDGARAMTNVFYLSLDSFFANDVWLCCLNTNGGIKFLLMEEM